MSAEAPTCALCGQSFEEDPESKVLELKGSGQVATVCGQCYGAIGDDGDDEFLAFLLSA